ncbi:TonB-dependent receptor [Rhodanobacter sp. DHB23]|uniref:TonB-dependent receptor n=1 Tax=Rhodanobacter sp. DHB23 TaxID=2775923 RepID=UPI0017862AEE|nr:TonB-dependent receptor [Rhodanobacter sp. DHB23]MBD8871480.1 TonB-dependent receptor [Rhodanobacter sp. DHB23]
MDIAKFRNSSLHAARLRRTALAIAVVAGVGMTGQALAQATTGSVFGTAPVSSGETVRVVNNQTGLTREVAVGNDGRYSANQLPVGDYTVSLVQNGNVISTHDHVQVSVSGGTPVAFAAAGNNVQNLSSVTVTANSLPAIDVSSTRQSSVITAQQLKTLPIAHSAEAIALLAPGVNPGASDLGNGPTGTPLVSMGGNSVVENAYYLNGFNTTDPIGGSGGVALPYFAISEQQTITGGYGPEYGRSTGGVISQIGQRGSNDFHAGVYVSVRPAFAESNYDNILYSNPQTPIGDPQLAPSQGTTNYVPGYGQIQRGNRQNSDWNTVYDAYLSGPLIKDKLFFFVTAEWEHDSSQYGLGNNGMAQVPPTGTYDWMSTSHSDPKLYGKLDWNINDNNVLEFTGVRSQNSLTSDNAYQYNYSNQSVGSYYGSGVLTKNTFDIGILKYTSYITDDLTLEVLYGQMKGQYYQALAGGAGSPVFFGEGVTVPAGVSVPNTVGSSMGHPDHTSKVGNLRIDFDWKITADHDIKFGIDNMQNRDDNDGSQLLGGATWNYACGVLPTGGNFVTTPSAGCYATENLQGQDTSLAVHQMAQYVEDRWQATPNLLLDLGLRNDQFTNYVPGGVAYVRETKPQWAPRLGFSWDVFGDSSFKVFGNAGRYYLAIPTGLASRNSALGSYLGTVNYTYSGIGPTGLPIDPVPVLTNLPACSPMPAGFYSPDGEYGCHGNAKDYAATNLKAEYQDEYVLGFQKLLGDTGLVFGMQGTYERVGNLVDDTDLNQYCNAGLVNPGKTNYIPCAAAPGGVITWNPATYWGQAQPGGGGLGNIGSIGTTTWPAPSRKYYALDTYLEHTWDGKWYGKVDYVFSKSYGSSEGPTDTAVGQITNQSNGGMSGSTTVQWDYPDIMQYANGELPNSRRHTLKAFGAYSITPEWMVSATYIIQSGAPNVCLSGYGFAPNGNGGYNYADLYYGSNQHFCGGVPNGDSSTGFAYGGAGSPPGASGHTPWTHQLNLSLTYVPAWANKHLTFQAEVHNVFNEQNTLLYAGAYTQYAVGAGGNTQWITGYYNPIYKTAYSTEAPRYMDFSVKFDW